MRQLADRGDVEALVVDLDEAPILAVAVEPLFAPLAAVAVDARVQDQVVVARARDFQRVELEQAQPIQHGENARGFGRQAARWIKDLALDEETPRLRFRYVDQGLVRPLTYTRTAWPPNVTTTTFWACPAAPTTTTSSVRSASRRSNGTPT